MSGMNYVDLARSAFIGTRVTGMFMTVVLGRLLYWAMVPFYYLAYYVWVVLSFVLSPLWFLVDLVRSSTALALHLAVRFRYVYIYFACATMIGLLAALVLHGTSSLLFVMLRLHPSQQPPAPSASSLARPPAGRIAGGENEDEDEDEDEYDDLEDFAGGSSAFDSTATTTTKTSSGRASVSPASDPSVVILRSHRRGAAGRDPPPPSSSSSALYGTHWRALSDYRKAPVKPRHRGKLKGLLAQTIHEESSESESL